MDRGPLETAEVKFRILITSLSIFKEDAVLEQIVELRFFAGQTIEDIAEILDLSISSIERKRRLARAFLVDKLQGKS